MQKKNYYLVLNVKTTATAEEIKAAYRTLAKKFHPDKNQGNKSSEEYFKLIQEAYAVLSDPEKKRKFDLSFLNYTSGSSQKTYTQYTGNAYQYAQQQAYNQQNQAKQSYRKKQPSKPDQSEKYGILISIGIAMILLYAIISFSSEKTMSPSRSEILRKDSVKKLQPEEEIGKFDSPYSMFFGEEVYEVSSKNNIVINNSHESEAVVCLVENKPPFKTIRNQYMNFGTSFKFNNIPDGSYFLKIYFGREWKKGKTLLTTTITGGFSNDIAFAKLNTGKDAFIMKQGKVGNSTVYSSYEIDIYPYKIPVENVITGEEFFD
ncbi:MAG: DnaJ domain-containing protein [Bacteroidota bacterium]|nr:DnaJ domain-containing protein [Bacteroidota bacterium]